MYNIMNNKLKMQVMKNLTNMGISIDNIDKAFDTSNNLSEIFEKLSSELLQEKAEVKQGKPKKLSKEEAEGVSRFKDLKDVLNQKKGRTFGVKSKMRKRFNQMPSSNSNSRVRAQLEQAKKLKEVNSAFARIERDHSTQADEIFKLVRSTKTGNALKRTQNSIAEYRSQKNRYNVVKKLKDGGAPSSALAPIPI